MIITGFDVVRRREKPARLAAFFDCHSPAVAAAVARSYDCLVVARSLDSFVAQAAFAVARLPVASALRMRALIAQKSCDGSEAFEPEEMSRRGHVVRFNEDSRLLDAHEMLVFGPRGVWVGDSMRRDPAACDSYECHSIDCLRTAASARRSFERLWRASEAFATPDPFRAPMDAATAALWLRGLNQPPRLGAFTRH